MIEKKIEPTAICPALGLRDDRTTCFAFPNSLNCCHRAGSPQPITGEYQDKFCLTARHLNCTAYTNFGKNVQWESVNRVVRYQNAILTKWKKILITIVGAFLFLSVFFIGMFTTQLKPSAAVQSNSDPNPPVGIMGKTSTQGILQSPLLATTEQPSTPTPGPGMGTPFGPTLVSAGRFVLHEVQAGETLIDLARKYHTSLDVLGAANQPVKIFLDAEAMLASADVRIVGGRLMPGTVLIVLPWRFDPEGVPQFNVIYLTENTRVDDLASREGISVKDLRFYNDLGGNPWIPAGRSLIIPLEN